MNSVDNHFGVRALELPVPVSPTAMRLISAGITALWERIVAADVQAAHRPLLLSYDVHPSAHGPVLIEVNTNAGGILTALQAARHGNDCCADLEHGLLEARLLALFQHDLLGKNCQDTGVLAIVDDQLEQQALKGEMLALADLLRPHAREVLVLDAADLHYQDGRLRHGSLPVDRVYWRSTDFMLQDTAHADIRQAVAEGSTILAPSAGAYQAIADKRRFVDWSSQPVLSEDPDSGLSFRIAETVAMSDRPLDDWYANRRDWVFKPTSGHASRGVYVGKRISRKKLAELPMAGYLAQRYAPHPELDRSGVSWKYDVRFYADRGQVIGAAARVFQGQVVGMRTEGSGFAPVIVGSACCLTGALWTARNGDVVSC